MINRGALFVGLALVLGVGGCSSGGAGPGTGTDGGADSGGPGDDGGGGGGDDGGGPGGDAGPDCIDDDGDGYGEGCRLGSDCNDDDASVNPGATETCNGVDDDCDGEVDEELEAPSCSKSVGVCAGAKQTCAGELGWTECGADEYGDDYEEDESLCDGLDNDCDGSTDEGCPCTVDDEQACGSDEGVCEAGTQTCLEGGTWGPCEDDVGPMGESCDGLDNDCDGDVDEAGDLTAPDCPLTAGVCSGAKRTCEGEDGWGACAGTESYGDDYEESETSCDGLDNDCDGNIDESCSCTDGDTQPCGTDVGACTGGTQTCSGGAWGGCSGATGPSDEECNGIDDDCDGDIDDGLTAPACELTAGVCAGATKECGGTDGWLDCNADNYGSDYEADETKCDGLDNDCDGMVDEGCECVVDEVQECGSATGACERGTQTCGPEGWGECEGGVDPEEETCNGLDDDCNGSTDDNLDAPACELTEGVCAGATKECGGADGWLDCADTGSYGPDYVAEEDGGADEALCDGLDNDCDGEIDEGCTSGPLLRLEEDVVFPSIYNQHVAFLGDLDGNWDVLLYDLRTGSLERLTETAESEGPPQVYGNIVVYTRGEDADSRVVVFDLEAGTEQTLTSAQSGSPSVSRNFVVYDDARSGTDWDIYATDLTDDSELGVANTIANEIRPYMRGGRIAYAADDAADEFRIRLYDGADGSDIALTGAPAGTQLDPRIDYLAVGWTDGRDVVDPEDGFDDWHIFGADIEEPTTEITVVDEPGSQLLGDIDGYLAVWSDYRNGNWDVGLSVFGTDDEVLLTSSEASQGGPAISGNIVVWHDNRNGSFDIYASALGGRPAAEPGNVTINEVLADPPSGADVNGDGTASSTQDEFVELTNGTGIALDISGYTLSDDTGVRHTFPEGTVIPAVGSLVVFGGGEPAGRFGGVRVMTASTSTLGLNNDGDSVTLAAPDETVIDTMSYGGEGGADQSLVRDPEIGGEDFIQHSTAANADGRAYSPGTMRNGYAF